MEKSKFLKRVIATFLVFVMMLNTNVIAADEIKVEINGVKISSDVAPEIINGRTMIPLRSTLEALGAKVDWVSQTKTATALTEDYSLKVQLNNVNVEKTDIKANYKSNFKMDVAPVIKNGRTLVPVRFMAELLGKKVVWDNVTRTVIILDEDYITNYLEKNASNFLKLFDVKIDTKLHNVAEGEMDLKAKIYEEGTSQELEASLDYDAKVLVTEENKFDKMSMNFELKLNDTLNTLLNQTSGMDEIDFSKLDFEMYMDNEKIFVNSSLFKEDAIKKFIEENSTEKVDLSKGVVINVDDETFKKQMDEAFLSGFETNITVDQLKEVLSLAVLENIETVEDIKSLDLILKGISILTSEEYLKITEDKVTYEITLDTLMKLVSEIAKDNEDIDVVISAYKSMIKEFKISYDITSEKVEGKAVVDINMPDMLELSVSSSANSTCNPNLKISDPNTKGAYEGNMSELQGY